MCTIEGYSSKFVSFIYRLIVIKHLISWLQAQSIKLQLQVQNKIKRKAQESFSFHFVKFSIFVYILVCAKVGKKKFICANIEALKCVEQLRKLEVSGNWFRSSFFLFLFRHLYSLVTTLEQNCQVCQVCAQASNFIYWTFGGFFFVGRWIF